jgi:hypothetical protein
MSKVFAKFVSDLTLKLAVTMALIALVAQGGEAQSLRGSVTGTVADAQDSGVGAAQVKVTNQGTGITATTVTNDFGFYRVSALDPGVYRIEFNKMGFETKQVQDVQINASQEKTISMVLGVSTLTTTITVKDVPGADLSKTNPTIQITLPGEALDNTPMTTTSLVPTGSRNFLRFPFTAPNVARVPGQNETSANGHTGRQNNYMLDGVNNNDSTVTLPALFAPPEAIQEVHVQVAPFSAEFGKNIGAQVNVVTKSGSNAFHGEAWEFYRSNALEPLSLQARKAGFTRNSKVVNHQFGGSLGGPIIRDRTFFFGMLQGFTAREAGASQASVTIPTPTGFASLPNVPLRSGQSAASRQAVLDAIAFLPEVYPQIRNFDSTSTILINAVPIEVGTFVPVIPQNQDGWYSVLRADHRLTSNDQITYRIHLDDRKKPLNTGNLSFGERFATDSKTSGQNHALSYIRTINNSFINESRLAYTRLDTGFKNRDNVRPTIVITNFNNVRFGSNENFPQERLEQNYQFQNTSTYMRGRQSLRFGIDLARIKLFNNIAAGALGRWIFQDLAGFMNNSATQALQIPPANRYSLTQTRQAYFVQDDLKLSRNLTVNLGLRYETGSVPLGYFGATDPAVLAALVPAPGKRDSNNWAPRVGFGYNSPFTDGFLSTILPAGRSAIRGGFGMAYDQMFFNVLITPSGNYPRNSRTQITATSQLVDVYPNFPAPSSTLNSSTVFTNIPTDAQVPTTSFWTLSVQRQIATDYSVEIGYSGSRSYHLMRLGEANPGIVSAEKAAAVVAGCTTPAAITAGCENPAGFPRSPSNAVAADSGRINPLWASRALYETSGGSEYHAGYARIERKLSSGLNFGLNYTWSANLSDTEDVLITDALLTGSSPLTPQNYFNRRNEWARSVLDRPHRLSMTYSYAIPGFSQSHAVLRHALSGWQVNGFTEVQSGQPYTIIIGVDALGAGTSGTTTTFAGRPNYNPNGVLEEDFFGKGTFRIPKDGTGIVTAPFVVTNAATGAVTLLRNSLSVGGNLGRNTFRGLGYANTNLSIQKRFALPRDTKLQIRSDFINVFNHDNFANPDANMNSSTFGRQTLNPLTDARQVLLGAKFIF